MFGRGEDEEEERDYVDTDKFNMIKKKKNKYRLYGSDEEEEGDYNTKKRDLTYKYNDTLISNLSESFSKGRPTKIKIFKCVVWRNVSPGVNEDTIKNILRKSGSQIFEKGGFVVKLPKEKAEKLNQGLI